MENIHFSENLVALRKGKGITQEQLADFCGVTKASVSKWETKQSMPDILLLPQLASFFDVTIDELIGYEAYLSEEQIQRVYESLAEAFTKQSFADVMEQSRGYVKRYYSCYGLLERIVLLWLNHKMLAGEYQQELLKEAGKICEHILAECRDIRLCNDVIYLQSIINLQLGNSSAVIEALEEMNDPARMCSQSEDVLMGAYIQAGFMERADEFAQAMMYQHLIGLVSDAVKFLVIHQEELDKCEETMERICQLVALYNLEEINFHFVAVFAYQMAVVYCRHGEAEKAVEQFEKYVELTFRFLRSGKKHLRTDDYFDKMTVWFEKNTLAGNLPREKKVIYDGLLMSFETPCFEVLQKEERFMRLRDKVQNWKVAEL